jgi:hypothetical protein
MVRMEISQFLWELLAPLEEFESFLILPLIFRITHISTLCEQWRPMPIAILEGGLWICKYVKNISSDLISFTQLVSLLQRHFSLWVF